MTDVPSLSPAELEEVSVFPLPSTVFFPDTDLPLHLFEERYRAMAEDRITHGNGVIAIALLRPGYEAEYDGRPAIHTVAGIGRVIAHRKNQSGTHDIVLRGLGRVRLDELPMGDRPYRLAKATPLRTTNTELSRSVLAPLLSCTSRIAAVVRERHPDFEVGFDANDDIATIVDRIADRFVSEPPRRQRILEAIDLEERLELVTDAVGDLLALIGAREEPS
jgi:Lon protease-like protein